MFRTKPNAIFFSIQTPDQYVFIYTAVLEKWDKLENEDVLSVSSLDSVNEVQNGENLVVL